MATPWVKKTLTVEMLVENQHFLGVAHQKNYPHQ
jgi:hypothetical protein